MSEITTFEQALAAIRERSGYDRGYISNPFAGDEAARNGLRRTQAMLDALGNPERAYPIVHVAGSKGKGSTCVFVDAILRASGRRSGRYLSPHLHSYLERFVVDDLPIAEADFTTLTADAIEAARLVEASTPELGEVTAFELTTAMALLWFARAGCDVAVIEVGLGGKLDATNVVAPAVSVITPLDYEHTAILGSTMAEIADNKAGIIKPGRPVVSAAQPDEGMRVIEERASAASAQLLVAGRDWRTTGTDRQFSATGPWGTLENLCLSLPGRHQIDNAALAIAAVHALGLSDITAGAIRDGLSHASLPGRFEQADPGTGQTVIIDGAHSPSATSAIATTLRDRFPDTGITIVVGMLRDKDPTAVLTPLVDLTDRWVAVEPESPRALPAAELVPILESFGMRAHVAGSVAQGIRAAIDHGTPTILVTGSLTTAAEARVALGLAGPAPSAAETRRLG